MQPDLKKHLKKVSLTELTKKIERFRKIDFRNISYIDLRKKILDVLSFENHAILEQRSMVYSAGTRFYRVRKLGSDENSVPLKTMRIEQDAWNPPEKFITKKGRLNKIKESLLYVCPQTPAPAIEELKIQDNEYFCLIVYESRQNVKTNVIGIWEDSSELTEEENLKMRIINNFLHDEFTREVGEGTEHLYRISEIIAKEYFDLPPKIYQDAWCYPSIANKQYFNVCFRPDLAKSLLHLIGFQLCTVKRNTNGYNFQCWMIASGFDNEGNFIYHHIDSETCREKFPEISLKRL